MKPFVFIYRQGSRILSEEEQKRRADEVRAWALKQIAEGRKLDPHLMGPEYYRTSAEGESDHAPAGTDSPPVAIVFLEARDFGEAIGIAKTHPGIRYGVSIEVRPWTTPILPPKAG
jgi:hypothetical protein